MTPLEWLALAVLAFLLIVPNAWGIYEMLQMDPDDPRLQDIAEMQQEQQERDLYRWP